MNTKKMCSITKSPTAGIDMVSIVLIDTDIATKSNGDKGIIYENTVNIENKEQIISELKLKYNDILFIDATN